MSGGQSTGPVAHELLMSAGVAHRVIEHSPTYRARQEAAAVGVAPARVAKTVVTVDNGEYRLAVIPAHRQLDLRRMRSVLGASRHLRLARESELAEAFPQFEVGAIPPLGRMIGVDEIIDAHVLAEPEVVASAGDHDHSIALDAQRLVEAAQARVADICEPLDDDHRHRFTEAPFR